MQLHRRHFIAGGSASVLAACQPQNSPQSAFLAPSRTSLEPFKATRENLMKVTVCTRPFRPAGPRLEVERFGEKTVVHNYGHGGSGWSLSWGCAAEATAMARSHGHTEFAVIGAGVIGLTTANRLAETGAKVTVYAGEFPAETRSARATGVWSPSSRIGLTSATPAGFAERWEQWARYSHAKHVQMIGLDDEPIEYIQNYFLRGGLRERSPATRDFISLGRSVRSLNPPWRDVDPAFDHLPAAFAAKARRTGQSMIFNVARYSDRLATQFRLMGGRMVRRRFADRAEALALPERVIINCMGYGAKSIWGADDLVPVRGQINWLLPQENAPYGFYYDGISVVSRRDGVVVQDTGANDDFGYGDDSEAINREETTRALETVRQAYI